MTQIDRRKRRAPRQTDGATPPQSEADGDGRQVVSLLEAPVHDEPLPYTVELWSPSHRAVDRILGQAANATLAAAIYEAALEEFPGRLVTLSRDGQRLRPQPD